MPTPSPDLRERFRGALLGLAAGDALGTTVEFEPPGSFAPLTDIVGGGPFGLKPGQWTDDTSMAICLAESLVERSGFDARDQMKRYLRWYRQGYHSSTGVCFDIGITTSAALHRFESTGEPMSGPTAPDTAGNGSLMRLAPVALFYSGDPRAAVRYAAQSSRTTHGNPAAVDACRYFAGLLVGAASGVAKDQLLGEMYSPVREGWTETPLVPEIEEVARGSFRRRQPPEIRGSGYVVRSLEAALWALHHHDDFRSGALAAVNLGEDADTTGAIYGQLAGTLYGAGGIPASWRERIWNGAQIEELADALLAKRRELEAVTS